MEAKITNLFVIGRVKLDSRKMEQLLGRQPKLSNVYFSLFLVGSCFVLFLVVLFMFFEVLKLVLGKDMR